MLGGEGGDRAGHDRGVGGGERADAQPPGLQARDGLHLGLGRREAVENRVGVLEQHAAGLGQPDAARGALEQLGAGLALERRDLPRDGGLGEAQRLGGG
jgi:hypothetical protein